MEAAIRVIATQGLGAPTMKIAEEARVANGSLFTYFETKADLFNQLYLELKADMASAALDGLPARADLRNRMSHVWSNWMEWAVSNPQRRSALMRLGVSDEITPATRAAGHKAMTGIAELMQQMRASGPMRNAPMPFVASIMNALAEATMDFMIQDPANAKKHCKAGFDAFWRAIA
ncbi:TetR/AcrR family transcriptional regulator [Microbacteriaceae bacterium K1510]|nr:TetR/AcrR family transcriptional regulator [Microbacteriaceae bacterium K1510]